MHTTTVFFCSVKEVTVPDQLHKQAFEMRFCAETMFLIKLTGQAFIFIDCNSLNF